MTTATEVFRLRKTGDLGEAFVLAEELMTRAPHDVWNLRAYLWCLIDLVKAAARGGDGDAARRHSRSLEAHEAPEGDDLLRDQRRRALDLIAEGPTEAKARQHSKAGRYRDAVDVWAELARQGPLASEAATSCGWDLYRATKAALASAGDKGPSPAAIQEARRHLHAYLALPCDRPSLVHSLMLGLATRLAKDGHLKLLPFSRLWDLRHLRVEDHAPYIPEDGKPQASLAEKAILRVAREAIEDGRRTDMEAALALVESLISRDADVPWPTWRKIGLLVGLGRRDEALALALRFTRAKAGEYWAWERLGDLQGDPALRLACYAKALTCSQDDDYVCPVRLKLAQELAAAGRCAEARAETERVITHKAAAGHRLPPEALRLRDAPWFAGTEPVTPSRTLYARLATPADEFLFADLPWIDACLGGPHVIPGRESKPKRLLFLRGPRGVRELSVPNSLVRLKGLEVGAPIRLRLDGDMEDGRCDVRAVAERPDGVPFDVFTESLGAIAYMDREKGQAHWVVGREAHGTVAVAEVVGTAAPGAPVALRLATHRARTGERTRAVTARVVDRHPGSATLKSFAGRLRLQGAIGFVEDVFLAPDLVRRCALGDGTDVSGLAVSSWNRKHERWGWAAVEVMAA